MLPIITKELNAMTESLEGFQYQSDHTELIVILVRKLGQGVKVRLIFDKENFKSSSCARQAPRMKELYEAGAELKMMRPPHGGFACMHVKTLVVDRKVLLTGSVNMTHNGLEKNKEHLYRIENPSTIETVMTDFEEEWQEAEPVTDDVIENMMEKYAEKEAQKEEARIAKEAEKEAKKEEARSAKEAAKEAKESRVRSKSRSVSRSLSAELESAETETPKAKQ